MKPLQHRLDPMLIARAIVTAAAIRNFPADRVFDVMGGRRVRILAGAALVTRGWCRPTQIAPILKLTRPELAPTQIVKVRLTLAEVAAVAARLPAPPGGPAPAPPSPPKTEKPKPAARADASQAGRRARAEPPVVLALPAAAPPAPEPEPQFHGVIAALDRDAGGRLSAVVRLESGLRVKTWLKAPPGAQRVLAHGTPCGLMWDGDAWWAVPDARIARRAA